MRIADRTPFRGESGEIDLLGRAQGTLKYGLSWYARLQAQATVIAVLEKVLGPNYVLLRNITLPDTDIDLPLVLIGPPGVYLINVTHERGVYRARDNEWGKVTGEKFVPAGINLVERTAKLGRVLQIYLDRAGYKGSLVVEPIMMAADPGMHIDSIRPVVRIVMSDALERFAISMNQARAVLDIDAIKLIAMLIVNGPQTAPAPIGESAALSNEQDNNATLLNPIPSQESNPPFSPDSLGFSFDDSDVVDQAALPQDAASTKTSLQKPSPKKNITGNTNEKPVNQKGIIQESSLRESGVRELDAPQTGTPTLQIGDNSEPFPPPYQPGTDGKSISTAAKKIKLLGMGQTQLAILAGIFLCWLCIMAAFGVYIYTSS